VKPREHSAQALRRPEKSFGRLRAERLLDDLNRTIAFYEDAAWRDVMMEFDIELAITCGNHAEFVKNFQRQVLEKLGNDVLEGDSL